MKRNQIIMLLVFTMMISVVSIMTSNSVYALGENYPENITLTADATELVLIEQGSNKIALPANINYKENTESNLSNPIFFTMPSVFSKIKYSDVGFFESVIQNENSYNTLTPSLLMGYLLYDTNFTNNQEENNYYKQLLILWALDRLEGFEDDYNYIDAYPNAPDKVEKETSYDEKFKVESIPDYADFMGWRFKNRLSAGDKEMLKNSKVGNKMMKYLEEWDKYVKWYIDDNQKVELDEITMENITYYVTDDYIETNLITPASTNKVYSNKFTSYDVEASSPMKVININGEEQTRFNANEGFKIRIPINNINSNTLDISIKLTGYFDFVEPVVYGVGRQPISLTNKNQILDLFNNAAVINNYSIVETKNTDTQILETNQKLGTLNINVIDADSKLNLSNAEITVFDKRGNIIYRQTTGKNQINITLPVGDYTVKQTITPPNYEAKILEQKVTVTEDAPVEATLENIQLIEVPDLGKKVKGIITITGILAIIIGVIILAINLKNKKSN